MLKILSCQGALNRNPTHSVSNALKFSFSIKRRSLKRNLFDVGFYIYRLS